jgi:hypothetical protein
VWCAGHSNRAQAPREHPFTWQRPRRSAAAEPRQGIRAAPTFRQTGPRSSGTGQSPLRPSLVCGACCQPPHPLAGGAGSPKPMAAKRPTPSEIKYSKAVASRRMVWNQRVLYDSMRPPCGWPSPGACDRSAPNVRARRPIHSCCRLILSAGILVHSWCRWVLFGCGHASSGLGEGEQEFRRWDEVLAFVIG